jgi:hypothetical protein
MPCCASEPTSKPAWESLRSVIRLSVDFLVNPSVLFWLVLQLPLMSRWFLSFKQVAKNIVSLLTIN